jgi:hypothetical protein
MALEIVKQEVSGPLQPSGVERWRGTSENKPQQARTKLTIEQIVFELVLVAA